MLFRSTHGAKVRALRNGAEQQPPYKKGPKDLLGTRSDVAHLIRVLAEIAHDIDRQLNTGGEIARQEFEARRNFLLPALRELGFEIPVELDGAFYIYADVSDFTGDSLAFCEKLLADTGLAIAPGVDFDTVRGSTQVRLSFAGPSSDIDEALRRLGPWLSR